MNALEAFATLATTADSASVLADRIASELPGLEVSSRQSLLEILNPADRQEKVLEYLNAIELQRIVAVIGFAECRLVTLPI
jgi:hypothetical protein